MAKNIEGFDDGMSSIQMQETNAAREPLDFSKVPKRPQILAALAAAIGGFVLGNFLGYPAPVQPQLQDPNHTGDVYSKWYINLTDDQNSWVGALMTLGALLGGMTGGIFMDMLGRKMTLLLISIPGVLGWLLVVLTLNPSMLFIGVFMGGLAGGISSVVSPSYIGEISTPVMQGFLGIFFQLSICAGILLTSVMGISLHWRLLAAILEIFPLILVMAMMFVPESPYHLVKKGRRAEALQSLRWLRGKDFNIESEMEELEASVDAELANVTRASDLLHPWAYKPILTALALMSFQQVIGINAALFNSVEIFRSAGSSLDGLVSAVILNSIQLGMTVVATGLITRVGRRTLFLISQLLCCLSITALGVYFYIQETDKATADTIGWLPLASLMIYIGSFAVGSGPIPWVMTGEIVPRKVKSLGVSLATLTNWGCAFIISKTYVDLKGAIHTYGAFWLFGGMCFLGVLFSIFLLPETKDKTPDEIQAYFGSKPAAQKEESSDTPTPTQ